LAHFGPQKQNVLAWKSMTFAVDSGSAAPLSVFMDKMQSVNQKKMLVVDLKGRE